MDISAQLKLLSPGCRPRRGIALPSAIFALVAVGLLSAGVFALTDSQNRSVRNRETSARALMLAEEGVAHALTVLRDSLKQITETRLLLGNDSIASTADDGLLIGYGLSSGSQIPATGVVTAAGTYQITFSDDPDDGDGNALLDTNNRIRVRCTATTTKGGAATIEVIIGAVPPPAMATEGSLTVSGNPSFLGKCGGAHANTIAIISGTVTVTQNVSASQTVNVSGAIQDTLNQAVTPLSNEPPVDVPDLDPMEYCPAADYVLRADGTILVVATSVVHDATSDPIFGWKRASSSPIVWDLSGNSGVAGTYCAHGNIKVSGNPGSAETPLEMSLIATGSISISGNPHLRPSHPDGIGILAGADVVVSGNPLAGATSYEGLIYSGSQCKVSGNPTIAGQVLCKDKPNPAGSTEEADMNSISGNATIMSDCSGKVGGKRRILDWFQPIG